MLVSNVSEQDVPAKLIDKNSLLTNLKDLESIQLELGCGNRKRLPNSIGIDVLDYDQVDIVGDILEILRLFPENSVDLVSSHHVLEHIDYLEELVSELGRVIKTGGRFETTVPHFSNPYYYSDYTHKHFFGLYSFSYLASSSIFQRNVPTYQKTLDFEIVSVDLKFKSPSPFYVRYGIKRMWGAIFNLNYWIREFYEENLCYLIPCYEINFVLKRL